MPRLSMTGLLTLADFGQQIIVLHIARADLKDVGVLADQFDILDVHHFSDD